MVAAATGADLVAVGRAEGASNNADFGTALDVGAAVVGSSVAVTGVVVAGLDTGAVVAGFADVPVAVAVSSALFASVAGAEDDVAGVVLLAAAVVASTFTAGDLLALAAVAGALDLDAAVVGDVDLALDEGFLVCPEARGLVVFATDRPLYAKFINGLTGAPHATPVPAGQHDGETTCAPRTKSNLARPIPALKTR